MAELDVRTLSVTLRSASGTIGYSSEIYDENYVDSTGKTGASQSDINQELKSAIGKVEHPINGVATDDKILKVGTSDKLLSSTLSLEYADKGDGKRIYLTGIDNAVIASIDASDFIKDRFVKKAELIETAETGITIEVPYIKLTFSDDVDPLRFSVKSLIDTYTGANLKLGSNYDTTKGIQPANNVILDAAIKNIDDRVDDNTTNIGTITTAIGTIVTKLGTHETEISNALNSISASSQTNYISLSAGTKSSKKQSVTLNATILSVGSGVNTATSTSDNLVSAYGVKDYINNFYDTKDEYDNLKENVSNHTTQLSTTLENIDASSNTNYIGLSATPKSDKKQSLTLNATIISVGSGVNTATSTSDNLVSAYGVKDYINNFYDSSTDYNTFKSNTNTDLGNLKENYLRSVIMQSTDGYIKFGTSLSNNHETVNHTVVTKTLSAASSSSNGLALAYDIKENCTIASVVGSSTYDEWDNIVS
jgi:hypothetical protein